MSTLTRNDALVIHDLVRGFSPAQAATRRGFAEDEVRALTKRFQSELSADLLDGLRVFLDHINHE